MSKFAVRCAFAAAALLLGTMPAQAMVIVYTVTLNGPSESPSNASPGSGLGIVTFDDVLDTMRVQAIFLGLTGTTTASHLHCCTAVAGTGTAGVATVTPTFTGFPLGVTSGSYDVTYNMLLTSSYNASYITANGGSPATAFAALSTGLLAGKGYLNIHTSTFGGGEIRGFLQSTTPIPEPGTYAMLLGGLGVVGFVARRRLQG